jgi:FkbM family methyltransferase
MTFISYAQNGEDVVLSRAFTGQKEGFYIDVGACDPVNDSVTLHFYERGWRGINIEPDAHWFGLLRDARPEDVSLHAAVGNGGGMASFFPAPVRGQGTLDPAIAARRCSGPPQSVPRMSLTEIVTAHAEGLTIDFLKVDVEGLEAEVLSSIDLRKIRPRVILVEAVDEAGEPSHEGWEPSLLAAGYRFALFDGLNRFYCREEEAEKLLLRLAAPANVLDNFRLAREIGEQEALALRERAARQELDQVLLRERAARQELDQVLLRERAARQELDQVLLRERAARQELDTILASTSWRVTEPLRNAKRFARLCLPRRGPS